MWIDAWRGLGGISISDWLSVPCCIGFKYCEGIWVCGCVCSPEDGRAFLLRKAWLVKRFYAYAEVHL